MADQHPPPILFIPFALCIIAIVVLLHIHRRQPQTGAHATVEEQPFLRLENDSDDAAEDVADDTQAIEADGPAEGSSTAVHIKKIGKKKGEKLRRKEQMRQYHEYLHHQREIRRAEEEVMEEEFKRRKAEEAIRQAEEAERRRKAKEKQIKQEEKERQRQRRAEEKEAKQKQTKFQKYSQKISDRVKQQRLCSMQDLGSAVGLSAEETQEILRVLCATQPEFRLSLWSGSHFLYVTEHDYTTLAQILEKNGKTSLKDVDLNQLISDA